MSVINSQPLIGASGNQGGAYNLTRSLRFRSSASAYLNRTPASAGNRTAWTLSFWTKLANFGTNRTIINVGGLSTNYGLIFFNTNNVLDFQEIAGTGGRLTTTRVFRDPSAWYHIVLVWDTANATAGDRMRVYVNGVRETSFTTQTNPSLSANSFINTSAVHRIGWETSGTAGWQKDGYLAEVNFIDGQALDPSSFGETSTTTGVWIPKAYTGSYGTNGFYLDFEDTSSVAALGYDAAGSNDWTVNNVSLTSGATYDSMTDVPTLTSATAANYATLNPISNIGNGTISAANLNFVSTTAAWRSAAGTIFVNSGKYYFEGTLTTFSGGSQSVMLGVCNTSFTAFGSYIGESANAWAVQASTTNTNKWNNNTSTTISAGQSSSAGDVFMVAVDEDAGKIWFGRNGTWYSSGDPAAGTNEAYSNLTGQVTPAVSSVDTTSAIALNCGQRPFAYTPPTGFVALNTFNLPTPTIGATASTQANKYMDATLYTGTGSSLTVTNAGGFSPDLVWIKSRSNAYNNELYDSVRGVQKRLISNLTNAESTSTNGLTAFNSNGFTQGGETETGANGATYVGWQWRGSDSAAVSNTSGSITSTVSANTSAGFSVVTWTGTGTTSTIGHGLGVAPSFIITKGRSSSTNWVTYHASLGNTKGINLDTTGAAGTSADYWNNTSPTSSVFTIAGANSNNANALTVVAYCFAEVAGYSAFGSYTGNGSTDGVFVYTGFRPKFIMIKKSNSTGNWMMFDSKRLEYNGASASKELYANLSLGEGTSNGPDELSNGFKLRDNYSDVNTNGDTYIYAAFAETPTKFANAR
jgi:hypothetical protein